MLRAFRFGAPPHGGIAPGVDRIVMLLADEPNIRETIAFPLNGNAQDLMMGAPSEAGRDPAAGAQHPTAQAGCRQVADSHHPLYSTQRTLGPYGTAVQSGPGTRATHSCRGQTDRSPDALDRRGTPAAVHHPAQ